MTEAVAFILGALALLATPGPTNTLLATSGAIIGFRKSLGLLAGELLGYVLAITVLRTAVGRLVLAMPALGTVLSALVCVYLLYLAWTLWRHGDDQRPDDRPVTVQGVFVTTLLNPKALIFAFMLLPSDPSLTWAGLAPWLGGLSSLIVTVGACWIAIGASLRLGSPQFGPQLGCRAGSVALVLFAGVISGRAVGIA